MWSGELEPNVEVDEPDKRQRRTCPPRRVTSALEAIEGNFCDFWAGRFGPRQTAKRGNLRRRKEPNK